jgi:hypothetical protein
LLYPDRQVIVRILVFVLEIPLDQNLFKVPAINGKSVKFTRGDQTMLKKLGVVITILAALLISGC